MKKFKLFAIALLFLTACEKETNDIISTTPIESEINSRAKKSARPFQLNIYTTADLSVPGTSCTGDLQPFSTPGQFLHGTASHLGQLDPLQSRLQDVDCDLSFTTALLITNISGQMAAANGDLIYFTGHDELNVFNLLTNSGPTGTITGTWTITGGTGRFAGATGSFTINGPVYFATSSFSFVGNGTITY